ncbi:ATP-binding protein, partial [candidate division KSB1 bacterium]|nr:ATP-binding protein [candidate division KSB1 bacterium]
MNSLTVKSVGQIKKANIAFGDLTVLIGPQATGKSIVLQLLKLLMDSGYVLNELKRYGLDWNRELAAFLDLYFGEGMRGIWHSEKSRISFNGDAVDLNKLVARQRKVKEESLFFIPAQRVLTLREGWPRPFTDFSPGDPFAVRNFSEKLRLLMETENGAGRLLFPQTKRLKKEIRAMLADAMFSGFGLSVERHRSQKRLVLGEEASETSLPYMVWSAGQREFVPLLLGLYWLLPPSSTTRKEGVDWVIIEELEMGLHPRAISSALTLVMELLSRGYKVCLSTHSTHVLDIVWAWRILKEYKAEPSYLLEILAAPKSQAMRFM